MLQAVPGAVSCSSSNSVAAPSPTSAVNAARLSDLYVLSRILFFSIGTKSLGIIQEIFCYAAMAEFLTTFIFTVKAVVDVDGLWSWGSGLRPRTSIPPGSALLPSPQSRPLKDPTGHDVNRACSPPIFPSMGHTLDFSLFAIYSSGCIPDVQDLYIYI